MAYRDEILADSPVLYYEMEETSGSTVSDSSGNGRDGTIHSTGGGYPIFSEPFNFTGNGLGFDNDLGGGTAFPEVNITTPLDVFGTMNSAVSFTVEAVIRLDKNISGADGYDLVYCISDSAGAIFQFCLLSPDYTSDVPRIGLFYNGGRLHVGNEYPNDNLEHLVQWTWDGGLNTITTWIDGIKGPSEDMTFPLTWAAVTDSVVGGLGDSGLSHNGFRGAISEFALFPSSLSDARLRVHGTSDGLATGGGGLSIDSWGPTSGPEAGGTTITFTGSGFNDVTSINFGGTPIVSWSNPDDTTLSITSPPGSGTAAIILSTPSGDQAVTFTYDAPPPPPAVAEPYAQSSDVRPSYPKALKPQPITKAHHAVVSSGTHGLLPQVGFRAAVFNGTKTNYGERVLLKMPTDTPEAKESISWTVTVCGALRETAGQSETNEVYNILLAPFPVLFEPPLKADEAFSKASFATLTAISLSLNTPTYIAAIRQSGLNLTVSHQPTLLTGVGESLFNAAAPGPAHPGGIGIVAQATVSGTTETGTVPVPEGDFVVNGVLVHVPAHDLTKTIPDLATLVEGPLEIRAVREGSVGPSLGDLTGFAGTGTGPGSMMGFHNSDFGICEIANFGGDGAPAEAEPGLVLYRVNSDLTIDFDLSRLLTASGDFGTFSFGATAMAEISIGLPMDPNRIVLGASGSGGGGVNGFVVIRHTGTTLSAGPLYEGTAMVYRPVRLDATHFSCEHYLYQINPDDSIQLVTTGFGNNVAPFNNFFPFSWGGPLNTAGAQIHQIDNTHVAQPTTGLINFSEGIGIEVYDYSLGAGAPWDVNETSGDFDTEAPNPASTTTPPFGARTEETKYVGAFLGGKCASTGNANEMLIVETTSLIWDNKHPKGQVKTVHRNQSMQALDMAHIRTDKHTTASSGSIARLILNSPTAAAGDDINISGFNYIPGATVTTVLIAGVTVDLDSPATVSDQSGWGSSFVVPGPPGVKKVTVADDGGRTAYTSLTVTA